MARLVHHVPVGFLVRGASERNDKRKKEHSQKMGLFVSKSSRTYEFLSSCFVCVCAGSISAVWYGVIPTGRVGRVARSKTFPSLTPHWYVRCNPAKERWDCTGGKAQTGSVTRHDSQLNKIIPHRATVLLLEELKLGAFWYPIICHWLVALLGGSAPTS